MKPRNSLIKEDISSKEIEFVKLSPLDKGFYNLSISSYRLQKDEEGKIFRYGSGYEITLNENQVQQFKEVLCSK